MTDTDLSTWSLEDIYEKWERELAQVVHDVDVPLVASLELEASRRGVELESVFSAITAAPSWDPDLHPRGKDGKFIELMGLVKLVGLSFNGKDGKMKSVDGRRGKVMAINPDPKNPGNPKIRVALLDKDGKPSVVIDSVKPSQIVQAPEKARLDAPSADAPSPRATKRADKVPAGAKVETQDGVVGIKSGIIPMNTDDNDTDGPLVGIRDEETDEFVAKVSPTEMLFTDGFEDIQSPVQTETGDDMNDSTDVFDEDADLEDASEVPEWEDERDFPTDETDMSSGPDWQQTGKDYSELTPEEQQAWKDEVGITETDTGFKLESPSSEENIADYVEFLKTVDDDELNARIETFEDVIAEGLDTKGMAAETLELLKAERGSRPDFDRGDLEGKVPGGFDPAGDHVEQFRNGNPPSPTGSDDFGKSAATYLTDDELDEVIAIRQSQVTSKTGMSPTADLKILQDEKARRAGTFVEPARVDSGSAADMVKMHALGEFDVDNLSDAEAQDLWETLLDAQDSPGDFPEFDGIPQDDVLALSDALQARYNVEGLDDAEFAMSQGQEVGGPPEWSIFSTNQKAAEVTRGASATFVDHPGLPDGVDFITKDDGKTWLRRDRNSDNPDDKFGVEVTDKDLLWELNQAISIPDPTSDREFDDSLPDRPVDLDAQEADLTSPVVMETGFRLQQQNAVDEIRDTFSADQFAGDLADEYAAFDQALLDYRDTMTGGRLDEVNAAKQKLVDRYYDVQDAAEWDEIDEDVTDTFQEMFESDLFEGNLDDFSAPGDVNADLPSDVVPTDTTSRGVGYDVAAQVEQIPDDVSPEIRAIWTRSAIGTAVKNATDPLVFDGPNDMTNPNVVARANLSFVDWDGDYNKQLDEIVDKWADDPALLQVISDARDTADRLLGGNGDLDFKREDVLYNPDTNEFSSKSTGDLLDADQMDELGLDTRFDPPDWVERSTGGNDVPDEAANEVADDLDIEEAVGRWQTTGDPVDGTDAANLMIGRGKERGDSDEKIRSDIGDVFGDDTAGLDISDAYKWTSPQPETTETPTDALAAARSKATPESFGGKVDVFAPGEGSTIGNADKWQVWVVNEDGSRNGGRESFDSEAEARAYADETNRLTALSTGEVNRDLTDEQLRARIDELTEDLDLAPDEKHYDDGRDIPDQGRREAWIELKGSYRELDRRKLDEVEPEPQPAPDAQVTGPDAGFPGSTVKLLDGGDAAPGSKVISVKDGKTYTIEGVYNSDKLKPDTYVRLRDENGKLSYKSKRTLKAASADAPTAEPDAPEASAPGGEPDVPLAEAPSAPAQRFSETAADAATDPQDAGPDGPNLNALKAQLADIDERLGGKWGDQFGNMGPGAAYQLKKLQADRKSLNEKIRILEAQERQAALDKKKQPRPADWKPKKIDDPEILELVKQTDAALWENSQEYDNPYYSTKDLLDVRRDQVGEEIAFARQFVGESNDQYITLKVPSGSEESIPLEVAEAYAAAEGIPIPASPSF